MLFICDKCDALENTASGHYFTRNGNYFSDEFNGLALCSECSPSVFRDGSINERGGKWHNLFTKEIMTLDRIQEIGIDQFIYLGRFQKDIDQMVIV